MKRGEDGPKKAKECNERFGVFSSFCPSRSWWRVVGGTCRLDYKGLSLPAGPLCVLIYCPLCVMYSVGTCVSLCMHGGGGCVCVCVCVCRC